MERRLQAEGRSEGSYNQVSTSTLFSRMSYYYYKYDYAYIITITTITSTITLTTNTNTISTAATFILKCMLFFITIIKFVIQRAERRRIVLAKAMKDRERNEIALINIQKARVRTLQARLRRKEHLANNLVVFEDRQKIQQEKNDKFFMDLAVESSCWLNQENIHTKINDSLFTGPATTGLVSKHSKHWRWHLTSLKLKRFMSPEYMKAATEKTGGLAKRLEARGHESSTKHFEVRDFLEDMIANGKDRENIEELIKKFTTELEHLGAFEQDSFDWYFDYMMEKSSGFHSGSPLTESKDEWAFHESDAEWESQDNFRDPPSSSNGKNSNVLGDGAPEADDLDDSELAPPVAAAKKKKGGKIKK